MADSVCDVTRLCDQKEGRATFGGGARIARVFLPRLADYPSTQLLRSIKVGGS